MLKRIAVLGVGGGGSNSVMYLYDQVSQIKILNLTYGVMNTDTQALSLVGKRKIATIQIGANLTKGGGAGADPKTGYKAAAESREEIIRFLRGHDMLFISYGFGGGTGSGAGPYIVNLAKEMGVITVVFGTFPWSFEGPKRLENAKISLNSIYEYADSILIINNDDLSANAGDGSGGSVLVNELFAKVNQYLKFSVLSIASLILEKSYINIDFNDVSNLLRNSGFGFFFLSEVKVNIDASEENASIMVFNGIVSKFSNNLILEGSTGLAINVAGNPQTLTVNIVSETVRKISGIEPNMNVIFGLSFNQYIQPGIIQVSGFFTGVWFDGMEVDPENTLHKILNPPY